MDKKDRQITPLHYGRSSDNSPVYHQVYTTRQAQTFCGAYLGRDGLVWCDPDDNGFDLRFCLRCQKVVDRKDVL